MCDIYFIIYRDFYYTFFCKSSIRYNMNVLGLYCLSKPFVFEPYYGPQRNYWYYCQYYYHDACFVSCKLSLSDYKIIIRSKKRIYCH